MTVPVARRTTHRPTAKPHIYKPHQSWVCFNSNARGEGATPAAAYRAWQRALQQFKTDQHLRSLRGGTSWRFRAVRARSPGR